MVEGNTVITVVWVVGIDAVIEEDEVDCVVADTGHILVPLKCSHSPFSWSTIWKCSEKIAQFALETSSSGTKTGKVSLVMFDIFLRLNLSAI